VQVRTLFFAAYRDAVGTPALELELPEGATVVDLVVDLRGRGAPFDRLPEAPAVAVNRTLVRGDAALVHGDEVAFLPPVAGG
jgi:molybdopterin synthase sulfur carrier subunit